MVKKKKARREITVVRHFSAFRLFSSSQNLPLILCPQYPGTINEINWGYKYEKWISPLCEPVWPSGTALGW